MQRITNRKRLSLSKETVRNLNKGELRQVAGGARPVKTYACFTISMCGCTVSAYNC